MVSVALTQKQWLRSDHGSDAWVVAAASVREIAAPLGLELHPEGRLQGPGMLGPLGWCPLSGGFEMSYLSYNKGNNISLLGCS